MAKHLVGKVGDLKPGEIKGVSAGEKLILLANVDGTFFAIGDVCTHRGCRLSGGFIVDKEIVECPCHGSQFNLITGAVVRGPAASPEVHYNVIVEGEEIYVEA